MQSVFNACHKWRGRYSYSTNVHRFCATHRKRYITVEKAAEFIGRVATVFALLLRKRGFTGVEGKINVQHTKRESESVSFKTDTN